MADFFDKQRAQEFDTKELKDYLDDGDLVVPQRDPIYPEVLKLGLRHNVFSNIYLHVLTMWRLPMLTQTVTHFEPQESRLVQEICLD